MKIKTGAKSSFLALSMLALSTAAISAELSYDFIQLSYNSITETNADVDRDGDGLSVAGSFSITPNLAFTASYGEVGFDRYLGVDVDATELNLGVTAHGSIAPNTDVFGSFSIVNGEIESSSVFGTSSFDDTGNSISLGLRHMATDNIEMNAVVVRTDIFDETSNLIGFGGRLYATEKFSVGAGYATGDDVDTIIFNARLDFK